MAQTTKIKVYYGGVEVEIELREGWWGPGPEGWKKISGPPNATPQSGNWNTGGSLSAIRLDSVESGDFLYMWNFANAKVKVGDNDRGEFVAKGYVIPQHATVFWEVLSIKTSQ